MIQISRHAKELGDREVEIARLQRELTEANRELGRQTYEINRLVSERAAESQRAKLAEASAERLNNECARAYAQIAEKEERIRKMSVAAVRLKDREEKAEALVLDLGRTSNRDRLQIGELTNG